MSVTIPWLPAGWSQSLQDLLLIAVILSVIINLAIIILTILHRLISNYSLPSTLPWAGIDDAPSARPQAFNPLTRRLATLRANLTSILNTKSLLIAGHSTYSTHNTPYVLPSPLNGPEVVLPPSQTKWLTEQPDSILSQQDVNRRFLEADFTFLHGNIVKEPVHPGVIRKELSNRTLFKLNDDIAEELVRTLEDTWGDGEEWREVKVYETMRDVISRLSVRVFLGEEFARNKEFVEAARGFDRNVVLKASLLNLLPGFLKPIFAPIITIRDKLRYQTIAKHVLPLIHQRLAQLKPTTNPQPPSPKLPFFTPTPPTNSYIDWAITHAQSHPDALELTPSLISRRLACLCFAAIQSSLITITNALFDIAASPDSLAIQSALRAEVERECLAGGEKGAWSKASLARMTCVDSTLRESMRLNGFVARGIMKTVVADGGVVLPSGERVPRGVKVGVQAWSVHRDGGVYSDAERFDAFRFVPGKSGRGGGGAGSGDDEGGKGRREPQALVTTSERFMAFSHGPNACPGRFFAANQLKLTLAHIALLYDVEPIPERPETKWFFGSMAAPMWETLRVRRRKVA